MARTGFKPFFDDEGNREFAASRRINDKGTQEVFDVVVKGENVRRDGKFQASVFLFALTKVEKDRLLEALQKV